MTKGAIIVFALHRDFGKQSECRNPPQISLQVADLSSNRDGGKQAVRDYGHRVAWCHDRTTRATLWPDREQVYQHVAGRVQAYQLNRCLPISGYDPHGVVSELAAREQGRHALSSSPSVAQTRALHDLFSRHSRLATGYLHSHQM